MRMPAAVRMRARATLVPDPHLGPALYRRRQGLALFQARPLAKKKGIRFTAQAVLAVSAVVQPPAVFRAADYIL
jgi:hypothetical protein